MGNTNWCTERLEAGKSRKERKKFKVMIQDKKPKQKDSVHISVNYQDLMEEIKKDELVAQGKLEPKKATSGEESSEELSSEEDEEDIQRYLPEIKKKVQQQKAVQKDEKLDKLLGMSDYVKNMLQGTDPNLVDKIQEIKGDDKNGSSNQVDSEPERKRKDHDNPKVKPPKSILKSNHQEDNSALDSIMKANHKYADPEEDSLEPYQQNPLTYEKLAKSASSHKNPPPPVSQATDEISDEPSLDQSISQSEISSEPQPDILSYKIQAQMILYAQLSSGILSKSQKKTYQKSFKLLTKKNKKFPKEPILEYLGNKVVEWSSMSYEVKEVIISYLNTRESYDFEVFVGDAVAVEGLLERDEEFCEKMFYVLSQGDKMVGQKNLKEVLRPPVEVLYDDKGEKKVLKVLRKMLRMVWPKGKKVKWDHFVSFMMR